VTHPGQVIDHDLVARPPSRIEPYPWGRGPLHCEIKGQAEFSRLRDVTRVSSVNVVATAAGEASIQSSY
jgi:hypothetical protein